MNSVSRPTRGAAAARREWRTAGSATQITGDDDMARSVPAPGARWQCAAPWRASPPWPRWLNLVPMPSMSSALRLAWIALAVAAASPAGCARDAGDGAVAADVAGVPTEDAVADATGSVTIRGDDSQAISLTWQVPAV